MTIRTVLFASVAAFAALQAVLSPAQETGRDRLLHYSLQIDIDDEARAQLAASRTELDRGDTLSAVSRWRALLDATPPESLVPLDGSYLSVPTAVRALLKLQTREIRQEYLQITEPIAAGAVQQAASKGDLAALRSVIERFPFTAAAEQASAILAERSFDAGEFQTCQMTVDRWLDDADNVEKAVVRSPELLVLRTLSLQALGDEAEAERTWSRFSRIVPPTLQQFVSSARATGLVPTSAGGDEFSPPTEVAGVAELLPSEESIWSRDLVALPPASEWSSLTSDFEQLAHPLLMINSPRQTAHGIVVSALGCQAFDFQGTLKALQKLPAAVTPASRTDSVDSLRAALGESMTARSTIAGDVLYTVEPNERRSSTVPYANRLVATSISSGKTLWTLTEFSEGAGGPVSPATVLGAPVERFGRLVIPIQSRDEIALLAIDATTRQFRWRTRLGDAGLSLMADTRRRWMPAVMSAAGDAILCATGNGAVTSLEIATGHLQWIHRSQREDWRDAGPPPMSAAINSPRFRMWTGWREPVLQTFDDLVIWAGPEADALTAFDRRTGTLRWNQPRGDRLAVVATKSEVLTIAEDEVVRLNPADGSATWSTSIPAPAGLGFHAAGWYVLPLRTGGTVALRLATGEAFRSVAWNAEVLGKAMQPFEPLRSLTWTAAGIIVQTPRTVALVRTVAECGRTTDVSALPQHLAAAGRIPDAINALSDADPATSTQKVRLEAIAREMAGDQFHVAAASAEQKLPAAVDAAATRRLEAFLVDRRPETAFSLLETSSLKDLSATWVESNSTPRLRIRADRLVAATLIDRSIDAAGGRVIHELAPVTQQRLDNLLLTFRSDRPNEIPELFALFDLTYWGAGNLLQHIERTAPEAITARQRAKRRLALMQLAAFDGAIGSRARDLLKTLTPKRSITDWPTGEIRSDEIRPWNSFIDHRPMTVDIAGETELAGLAVDFRLNALNDRKSGMIQFAGCGESRPWALDLPKTSRNLATSADYRTATVIGPLVLTQVGSGLFGFLAFDDNGERGISNLWDVPWIDVWGRVATHSVNFLPRLSDVAPGRHPIDLDDFGRPLTQLGPVTPTYFGYREFDRLVACETATGRRLWDRRHYDPDAFACGNDRAVILVSPRAHRIEFFDPLDGRRLLTRELGRAAEEWQTAFDAVAILRSSGRNDREEDKSGVSELQALDLLTDTIRWRQAIPSNAIDFSVGRRLVGAVDSNSIRLFDAATGEVRSKVAVTPPKDFVEVYAIDDPFALMIGVFTVPAVEQLRPPLMLVGSRRRPYANGMVYGFDPLTYELKWTIALDKSVFPLDQPRDIPLLVLNDAALTLDQQNREIAEDRIRCFDKRTGRQVGADIRVSGQAMAIERSQADGWVQIRTRNSIFRFHFDPAEK